MGQITLHRSILHEVKVALGMHMLEPNSGYLVLWTDAAIPTDRSKASAAVAFRADCESLDTDWTIKTYKVYPPMDSDGTELFAIAQALYLVLTRKVTFPTSSGQHVLAVFSDSCQALFKVGSYTTTQEQAHPLVEQIVMLTNALSAMGVQVQLHRVSAHKRVPGNEAADIAARRVIKAMRHDEDVARRPPET